MTEEQVSGLVLDAQNFQVLLAVLLYLAIFGWIGWRSGARNQFLLFLIAVAGYFILFERREGVVNFTVKVAQFAASLFGGQAAPEAAEAAGETQTLGAALQAEESLQEGFSFLLWGALVFASWVLLSLPRFKKGSKSNFWAIAMGVLNGFFLLYVTLPKLNELYTITAEGERAGPLQSFLGLIGATLQYLWATLNRIWLLIQPLNPTVVLAVIILILLLAALTLNRRVKPSK